MTDTDATATDATATEAAPAPLRRKRRRRRKLLILLALVVLGVPVLGPYLWTHITAAGYSHVTVLDAPEAPVAIVFGAQLADGRPKPFLAGRLDVAADLFKHSKVKAVLVSGDGSGSSGDETTAMAKYLSDRGVPSERIFADPSGLDTYDTCARAVQVYGVRKALLVSQGFHLPRAITLCRSLGMDADGVAARCDTCRASTLRMNELRELPANIKAVWDLLSGRGPAVASRPDPSVRNATTG